jgi:PTS system nitrogen regulatory IIA component
METDQLLSVEQVADYLQLNRSTVYDWAQKGKIPAIKLGQIWRFRRREIDRWLEAHKTIPTETR